MTTLDISINTDSDGFVSQECPACSKTFKIRFGSGAKAPLAHCPYCQHDGTGCWWTKAQAEYIRSIATHEVIGPEFEKMARDLHRSTRNSLFPLKMTVTKAPKRAAPLEPNGNMSTHLFPCCGETIKFEGPLSDLRCVICGVKNLTQ